MESRLSGSHKQRTTRGSVPTIGGESDANSCEIDPVARSTESHVYEFTRRDLARTFAPTLGGLALLALVLHGGTRLGWWPAPRPAIDMDRTILIHQAEASRKPHAASVVLIGDSSCLMDVVATNLSRTLGQPVLNLATLSYLDLPTHGRLLHEYATANPDALKTVVLLMHPESLRLAAVPDYFRLQIEDFLAGRDSPPPRTVAGRLEEALALPQLRGRLLSRALPWPLPGAFGGYYGFASALEAAMDRAAGSAVDPNRFDPAEARGSAEYQLRPRFENESRRFREQLPEGVRLLVGITPVPASYALPDHEARCRQMLEQWIAWLGDGTILEGLPATLPDNQFAGVTHLNAKGREDYTERLAAALRSRD
ncbi:MAG: hypothetical protein H7A46_14905 [Verrucomicrobiales bacterium]|nr:hypothetical protein [Verrucomicrobiales bacterium]